MNIVSTLLLVFISFILGGCSSTYAPPVHGDMATVKFEFNSKTYGKTHSFAVYEQPLEDISCNNTHGKKIGSDVFSSKDNVEFGPVKVAANVKFEYELFFGSVSSLNSAARCFSKGAFTPDTDKSYVVKHAVDLKEYTCVTKLYVMEKNELIEIEAEVPEKACQRKNSEFFGTTINVSVK